MYESGFPPTIPSGLTNAEWRHQVRVTEIEQGGEGRAVKVVPRPVHFIPEDEARAARSPAVR
jgi:hypothetical protein